MRDPESVFTPTAFVKFVPSFRPSAIAALPSFCAAIARIYAV
jgi:hypothetical protein